jgi:F5/8 type C domain
MRHHPRRLCSATLACILCAWLTPQGAPAAHLIQPRVLDDFDDINTWHVLSSDDVKATLRAAPGKDGRALCVDFDFGAVSGYVAVRRELHIDYPDNFEFSFDLRAESPANDLQFKLIDASGENVWWVNRPGYAFPRKWQSVRFKKRHMSFAWGPSPDHELRRSAQLEFVIARGRAGGKGSACFDSLSLLELPAEASVAPTTATVSASSKLRPTRPEQAFDRDATSAWRSDPGTGPEQTLTLDFAQPREFGGLVLHWLPGGHASHYTVELSDDGEEWRTVRRVIDGNGGTDPLMLPESQARYVRLHLQGGPTESYALAEIDVKDVAYGASANAFIEAIAADSPRGRYPRAFVGEQSYWTVVGVDGGTAQGLLSEDGALELGPQSASIEPFLITEEGLVTWADVETEHSLLDGYLPIPSVTWHKGDLEMRVTAFGSGNRAQSQLVARYVVANHSERSRTVTLALAARPFQVNPPTQFLNAAGGVAPIRELNWDKQALGINGLRRIFTLQPPQKVVAADFDAGDIAALPAAKAIAPGNDFKDSAGLGSAMLLYRLRLPAHGSRSVGIVAPLAGMPRLPKGSAYDWLNREQARVAETWRKKLNLVTLRLPPQGRPLADTMRSALAQILVNRAGPVLQPGSRAYARSWIRDGAMMADALLRLGHTDAVREYVDWFAPRQFSNGKVPCCVDGRGADPVAENDSQGELIHVIAQHYRYTVDRSWLRRMWPHVASATSYMDALSATQRTMQNQVPERRAFFGLMPASISHEGYSDRPAYSYWDDFWSLAGYKSATELAGVLRRGDMGARSARRDQFRADLHASLRASIEQHGIDYIPASADRGDFDPSATTVALSVASEQAALPQAQLQQTFERYWQEFEQRRDGKRAWNEYTPYELRNVGAFVRLGWRERAQQLLDFFFADRRPAGWNQWAEVVGRDARQPRFLGDMPHAWIASDFIQSALDLFAYEQADDHTLVLAAGVPVDWLPGHGIAIENLRTPYGGLSYSLRLDGKRLVLKIPAGMNLRGASLLFKWPYATSPGAVTVNGKPATWNEGNEVRIHTLPALVVVADAVEG